MSLPFHRSLASCTIATLLGSLAAGCAHAIPDFTVHAAAPQSPIAAPADRAQLVVIHGGHAVDDVNVIVFAPDGTPLCQVPHAAHCIISLDPGHHRVFMTWDRMFTDAWDLDVVAGRTYYGTMAPVPYTGILDEKLTADQPNWSHLTEYLSRGAEVSIDPARLPALRRELGDVQPLILRAESLMNGYDAAHRELHTFHVDDGT